MYKYVLLCLLCLSSHIVFSATIDPDIPDQKYLDYAKKFDYVGRLCGEYNNGKRYCGSGVVISDHIIITAAHVVLNSKSCSIDINGKILEVNKIIIHKDFHIDDNIGFNDIAIGISKEKFGLNFYPELYTESDELDKQCTIVGCGFTGTFLTGAISGTNTYKKRAGYNTIDYIIDNHLLVCSPSKRNDKDYTELEILIAGGDSGGGLFINGKLAGIHSAIMITGKNRKPRSTYGCESLHTRISKHVDWINENTNK
jgi:V8-like Glu-specific endopeptidase